MKGVEKMKKFLAIILCLVLALGMMTACGGAKKEAAKTDGDAAGQTFKIGMSYGTAYMERNKREQAIMQDYIKTLEETEGIKVELSVQYANDDAAKQQTQCETMLSSGVQVLMVYPTDGEAAATIVNEAHQQNVPVMAYDNLIMNSDLDYYCSFDSVEVGRLIATALLEAAPTGNYLILNGEPTYNNAKLVKTGFHEVLDPVAAKGDIKIIGEQDCLGWTAEQALDHTENALTANNNNIAAIATAYDGMAGGAVEALSAQGLSGKVAVGGQDGELTACQRIVEGTQLVTVYKDVQSLAKIAIETSIKIIKGEQIETNGTINNGKKDVPAVMPEIYSVNKDNMKKIIIDSGYQKLEDVYANIPKSEWPQ
jgi:D-xylose transport system substrate-binding protein